MSKEKDLSFKIMGEISNINRHGFVLIIDDNQELNISTNINGNSDDHSLIITILEGVINAYKKANLNKTVEHFDIRDINKDPK